MVSCGNAPPAVPVDRNGNTEATMGGWRLVAAWIVAMAIGCSSAPDSVVAPALEDSVADAPADAATADVVQHDDSTPDGGTDANQTDSHFPPVIACDSCTASQQCCSLVETAAGGGYVCKDACDTSARERVIACRTSTDCTPAHPYCVATVSGIAGTNDHGDPVCEMRVVMSGCTDPGHPLQPSTTCTPYDLSTSTGGSVVILCGSDSECAAAGSGHCCPTSTGFNWGYCGTSCPMY